MITKVKVVMFVVLLSMSFTAKAQLATLDVAAILSGVQNAIQQYDQQVAQYQRMLLQLQQMQQLNTALQGEVDFANLVRNPLIRDHLPADYDSAIVNLQGTPEYAACRNKYPNSANPKADEVIQNYCFGNASRQRFLSRSAARAQRIDDLRSQMALADTQAKKDALAIQLKLESDEIANDNKVMGLLDKDLEEKLAIAEKKAHQQRMCREFQSVNGGC